VDSWRTKTALQQPEYPDAAEAEAVLRTIESFPPLVLPGEARRLEERLASAAAGRAFLLQGGDCAESFREFGDDTVRATFRVLRRMSAVLMFGAGAPVVTVGRIAGQFGKPRSDAFEVRDDGVRLPKYRGDLINGHAFDERSRAPDPQRMLRAYAQSAATLNLLRALAAAGAGGWCDRVEQWDLGFAERSEEQGEGQHSRYLELARRVDEALGFMAAAAAGQQQQGSATAEFWNSHECLLLPYEQALTRPDGDSGELFYDSSAHMLWVGERTRQLDGAHVEFLRGVSNPLGIKVSRLYHAFSSSKQKLQHLHCMPGVAGE
jgi:3-deoxy-7-phosphoheptulonate synthase